jgi:hypothetical protein
MIDRFARKWYLILCEYELSNLNQQGGYINEKNVVRGNGNGGYNAFRLFQTFS